MSQKMGLKKINTLNKRGNELNLMNQYGEKLLSKKATNDGLSEKIKMMEERETQLLNQLSATQ